MQKLLFKNRWIALGWALMTMLSIGYFFSDNGGHNQLKQVTADIQAQKAEAARREALNTPQTAFAPEAEFEPDETEINPGQKAKQTITVEEAEDGDSYVVLDENAPVEEASDEELAAEESF